MEVPPFGVVDEEEAGYGDGLRTAYLGTTAVVGLRLQFPNLPRASRPVSGRRLPNPMDLIEAKGREVAEAIEALKALTKQR
jgi:hypothetical protein